MQEKKQELRKKKFRVVTPSANNIDEEGRDELVSSAEKFLRECGCEYDYGELFDKKVSYLSGDARARARELMDAFLDRDVDFVIASQGGNNSNDLLPFLDYDSIAKNWKPFFGLSDISVLLNVVAVRGGVVSYHGLDYLWGLGKNAGEYTRNIINEFCAGEKVGAGESPNADEWRAISDGTGEGVILGGCLPSFCLLLGTEYDPIEELYDDFILILEDIGQSKSEIHSMLMQLRLHKKFGLCRGIIFGSFFFCGQKPKCNNDSVEKVALRVFGDCDIPLVRIGEIGHCVENMVVPIGGRGRIEADLSGINLKFL